MQNVLKRKNMYLAGFQVILNFCPSKSYVLGHSESIDMHVFAVGLLGFLRLT